jgi:pSer/pThr/pTyr-binding forkhead associated (FHA) protein
MIRCPICRAENLSAGVSCAHCHADLSVDKSEERPTQRTHPKLVLVCPEPKAPDPQEARLTDHGIASIPDSPNTPSMHSYRLKVVRGLRASAEYQLYPGANVIGRSDDRPVDIDLRDQEPLDRIWASRRHAVVTLAGRELLVEDLNSTNGTYVNRHRVEPGSSLPLKTDDIIQIGTTQLKVTE